MTKYARNSDVETSHDAVDEDRLAALAYEVLVFLYENDRPEGWTAWEVESKMDDSAGLCPWHRMSDCRDKGYAEWLYNEHGNPVRRPGRTNRTQRASRITVHGRKLVEQGG